MKKQYVVAGIACATIAMCTALAFFPKVNALGSANPNSYGITMNSSQNKFHNNTDGTAYDGDAIVKTKLGNNVEFNYCQLKGSNSTWHVLANEGYFKNTTPILGIEKITLSFNTNNASCRINYSSNNSFDQSNTFTSSTSEAIVIDFDHYHPNYFMIENLSGSDLDISSIDISLSCSNYYAILDISSEDETKGTVSDSSGVVQSGTSRTVEATANDGYIFNGW